MSMTGSEYTDPYRLQSMWDPAGGLPGYFPTGLNPSPTAPELDAYIQYMLATGAMPDVDKNGEPVAFGLDTQKSALNYQQDVFSSLADPLNAYMAGPGAYAPGMLDPTIKETPIDVVQIPVLQQRAAAGGYQGLLASMILAGDNPATAVAKIQRGMNNPELLGLTDAEVADLRSELPPVMNTQGFEGPKVVEGQYDWGQLRKEADELWSPYAEEQVRINAPGVTKRDGRYYATEEIDSPQMEWLKKMGLPDPRAEYDIKWALDNVPEIRGAFDRRESSATAMEAQRKVFEAYTKKLTKQREVINTALTEDRAKMDRYGRDVQSAMSDYARGAGEDLFQRQQNQDLSAFGRAVPGGPLEINPSTGQAYKRGESRPYESEYAARLVRAPGEAPYQAGGMGQLAFVGQGPQMPQGPQTPQGYVEERMLPKTEMRAPVEMEVPERPQRSGLARLGRNEEEIARNYNRLMELGGPFMAKNRMIEGDEQRKALARNMMLASKQFNEDERAALRAFMPVAARAAQGRTPRTEAIQQRLLPLYTSGAFGQQGMPTVYPQQRR